MKKVKPTSTVDLARVYGGAVIPVLKPQPDPWEPTPVPWIPIPVIVLQPIGR